MAKMKVTLKAELPKGEFYWVTTVEADSEEEALTAAEHLFMNEMDKSKEWEFNSFEISNP
ncbi:MAG: hypothetical protein KAR62_05175 [Sphingomonadales bacterium]|nr:hypothetical protein [Sphingomonadales bacterium]